MIRSLQRASRLSSAGAVALAVLAVAAPGAAADRHRPDSAGPALQRQLDALVAAGAPGALALVDDGPRGGRRPAYGASGVADLRTGRPIRPQDRFRVGSLTKSFVATVTLQLAGEGRLSLSDTVEQWLPGLLPYGDEVTIRQLLNHTSGIPDFVAGPLSGLYGGDRFRRWQPRELVELVAGLPQDFPAGSAWSYSNTGYVIVGMIVERATRRTLGRELARRILRPLRLHDTSFPVHFPFLLGPHARGYSLDFDDELNPIEGPLLDFTVFDPSLAWGAGNIVSDLDDLARFYRALLGGRLLAPGLLAEMKTRVEIVPGVGYGLGLFVFDTGCGPLWGHSGSIPGFGNELFASEDGARMYALMMNADAAPEAAYEQFVLAGEVAWDEATAGLPCAATSSTARSAVHVG